MLLVNLGTPEAPEPAPVRRYLRQFLSDRRVLDLGPVGRFFLVNLVILPSRTGHAVRAYRRIWTEEGSPLRVHGRRLASAVAAELGVGWRVVLAMRYGEPSIAEGLGDLREAGCTHLVVLPLYPQLASSTTGTALEAVYRQAARLWDVPSLAVVPPFYDHPAFLRAVAAVAAPRLREWSPDHVLFSFHGLPERHVRRSDPGGTHCLERPDCCDRLGPPNRCCYRAHCYATARGLVAALSLHDGAWSVAFQSRLGRLPWIRPFTDEALPELARGGVRKLAVLCPSFVADCVETLEEIALRARADFQAAGGEDLLLVPALNSDPAWARAVAEMVREAAGGSSVSGG